MKMDYLSVAGIQQSKRRGFRALKNPVLHFVSYGLLTFNCLASSDLPDMQMYIFDNEIERAETSSDMKMVVFSDEASFIERDKPQGEDLRLAYSEDGQVSVYSEAVEADAFVDDELGFDIEFYVDGGYRQDTLDWTIAGPSGTPNILSELSWNNIDIAVVELGTRIQTPSNWVMDARFAYGTIFDGNNQDSDYLGNNRTEEFSRSNNNADEGSTIDASVSIGYNVLVVPSPIRFKKPILSFTPKVGFSYHAQNFVMTDGFQTIPAEGNFSGLDSNYDASWFGPWAGFDSELSIADWYSLTTSFEYHYAYYEASANWNLRDDFAHPISFEHEAEGQGIVASVGSQFRLSKGLFLNLSVDYQDWKADKDGIDKTFFADDSTGETKFNGVNWESMGANVGLRYAF